MLTLITPAGRNKFGQRLVQATCGCGNVFEARHDNVKSGRTSSCGHCGKPEKKAAPKIEQPKYDTPKVESTLERGSVAWFNEQIASAEAAADTAEKHVQDLQAQIAASETTDLDLLKKWNAESTTARKLRQDILRFQTQKSHAETAAKKDGRTQAELTREKIASLRGEL